MFVMGRKKRNKNGLDIEKEVLYGIGGIIGVGLALFLLISAFALAGPAGTKIFGLLKSLFGAGYWLLPFISIAVAIMLFRGISTSRFGLLKWLSALFALISGLGMIALIAPEQGGKVGRLIASPLSSLFDLYGTVILLIAIFCVAIVVLFDFKISKDTLMFWKKDEEYDNEEDTEPVVVENDEVLEEECEEEDGEVKEEHEDPNTSAFGALFSKRIAHTTDYTPPPIKLLDKDRGKPGAGDVKANANILRRTLANFGITVEVEEVTVGPTVTQYALKPAEGVRLSRILSLQNNLELALAAHPVRIEAPIPGKSLVGIEIPNSAKTTVSVGALIGSSVFKEATAPLFFALGRNVAGGVHGANLGKMPHLLIAGATGSGKSVAIHTLITSLLYRNSPDVLKFIMVDPKRVELTLYNNIPHLLTPVITDAKKSILALKWLITEMERRYDLLEEHSVRDIASYHNNVLAPALKRKTKAIEDEPDTMPYIVVIIDELADIMSSYPRELEAAIVRLAQMSRAVGIHLVLSTQRPSVNVITGLIKANVPARVALQVASQVDSRTILDMSGAEKLLGAGDMLFLSAEMSKPVRLQGGFISEKEVKSVVSYLKKNYETDESLELTDGGSRDSLIQTDDFEEEDELYEDAYQTVLEAGKASTSYLQRKLRVGYARAARLIDMLEERGVIGQADGSKPREVLTESTNPEDQYEDEDQ